jgi:hypothetical protein
VKSGGLHGFLDFASLNQAAGLPRSRLSSRMIPGTCRSSADPVIRQFIGLDQRRREDLAHLEQEKHVLGLVRTTSAGLGYDNRVTFLG